jgi:hypothetical protein
MNQDHQHVRPWRRFPAISTANSLSARSHWSFVRLSYQTIVQMVCPVPNWAGFPASRGRCSRTAPRPRARPSEMFLSHNDRLAGRLSSDVLGSPR